MLKCYMYSSSSIICLNDLFCTLPSGKVSETIWNNFAKFPNPKEYAWKEVPDDPKDAYFEEFKKTFSWRHEDRVIVLQSWDHKAARRYRDLIHNVKVNIFDPTKGRPQWIPEPDWAGWLAYWERADVKLKARNSRLSEPEGLGTGMSKHKGGSKSGLEYAIEFAKDKGVSEQEVTANVFERLHKSKDGEYDCEKARRIAAKDKGVSEQEVTANVFERLHKSKDGEYDCEKARRIARRMEERIQALSQPDPDTSEVPTIDRSKVFVEAVGSLDKRKRLFSANYMANKINKISGSSSSVGTPSQS